MEPLHSLMFSVMELLITYCDVLLLCIPLYSVLVIILLESDVVNIRMHCYHCYTCNSYNMGKSGLPDKGYIHPKPSS